MSNLICEHNYDDDILLHFGIIDKIPNQFFIDWILWLLHPRLKAITKR
jgi:hypothetical protein